MKRRPAILFVGVLVGDFFVEAGEDVALHGSRAMRTRAKRCARSMHQTGREKANPGSGENSEA